MPARTERSSELTLASDDKITRSDLYSDDGWHLATKCNRAPVQRPEHEEIVSIIHVLWQANRTEIVHLHSLEDIPPWRG